jgi:hypothetical protein
LEKLILKSNYFNQDSKRVLTIFFVTILLAVTQNMIIIFIQTLDIRISKRDVEKQPGEYPMRENHLTSNEPET